MERLSSLTERVSSLPRGTGFTRYCIALARAKGDIVAAAEIATQWRDSPHVATVLRAAMTAGTTNSWGDPLVPEFDFLAREFAELVRPRTVLGWLQGVRRVPFNVRIGRTTQGATVGWVGQGQPKVASELQFDDLSLSLAKIAGVVAITDELSRASGAAAEGLIQQDLIAQIARFQDEQFLSPGVSAIANVSPASITNGLTPIASAGASIANVITDISALVAQLLSAGGTLNNPYLIMTPATALALAAKRDSAGGPAFPLITVQGGTLLGLPVITSNNVPHSTSGGSLLILIDADGVLLADDGQAAVSISREASLQLDSAPSSSAAAQINLFQNGLTGIRVERYCNWARRRDTGYIGYVDFVSY